MGLFDGISLKGIVRDVTNVVGAFTGAGGAPQGDYSVFTTIRQKLRQLETESRVVLIKAFLVKLGRQVWKLADARRNY